MKLTLVQFMAFAFILGWVGTDVIGGATYQERLVISLFLVFVVGYLNNAHGKLWVRVKAMLSLKKNKGTSL
ncbi:MAG: hypothetical protein JSR17_01680 [Proteobacteria bacterium]|nr:hypothetical protein [Pseudomonadota bacterium]